MTTKWDEASLVAVGGAPAQRVTVLPRDCFDIICELRRRGAKHRLGVLNNANNAMPGGPTNLAGNTQEEQFFRRSNLGELLTAASYPIDRGDDLAVLATPGVVLDGVAPVCAISCAAISAPALRWDFDYDIRVFRHAGDREKTLRKMGLILRAAAAEGLDALVITPWGAGMFLGPGEELCRMWRQAYTSGPGPRHIVFSVLDAETRATYRAVHAPAGPAPQGRGR